MTALDDKAAARNEGQAAANVPNRSGSTEAPRAPRPADGLGGDQGAPRVGRPASQPRDTHLQPDTIAAVMAADHGDAFSVLGPHQVEPGSWEVRAVLPEAKGARLITAGQSIPFERLHPDGFYVASVKSD
ncbi:GlgB N-terminal domain-containing protein, partial [Methylobacterium sp. NPDC097303]